ncbi:class I SAM-dependent methyltransferase [Microvirga guangxiensis]|uniref:Methyltransferase domain-containing protein n=1 Tax=Microvirga guangxiensis TaxID=549386 RepID=A0A1G5E944_9HYPH|nr:class I SAM-dependent methyltransferase [Microvirga guangxiensis]SCY23028.1 Methyltransferase domain-containing protein [Microvirga guangxiensis]
MEAEGRPIPSIAGYAEQADALVDSYESITFEDVYRPVFDLLPHGGWALDIGAGTGRDAAELAARGFQVHAAEPTAELRAHAKRLHPDPSITWTDDALPDLAGLHAGRIRFDLVLMTAVWMHLDADERDKALPIIADLLVPGGRLFMAIRKGPVPPGRRMFSIPITPLIESAERAGLMLLRANEFGDMLGRQDVSWAMLAFERKNRV